MLNPEDVLYLVSSDLSEVKCFYGSFSDAGQKVPLPFKSSKKKAAWNRVTTTCEGLLAAKIWA